jgi:hypothetical protein
MSLPIGRGSKQVKSCGLLRKRDGAGRAVKVRAAEKEINARFSDVLFNRDSRTEPHKYGK